MIKTYIKIAWRNILKNKSATVINITGLSLGMAASILITLWVQNELSFDSYHPNADRIYHITMGRTADAASFSTPMPLGESIQTQVAGVEKVAKIVLPSFSKVLNIGNDYFREKGVAFVDREWFNLFQYKFINGNAVAFNQQPNSLILTASIAKKYFGNSNAIGRLIGIDSFTYEVKAVVKDNPINSSFQSNIFLPMDAYVKNADKQQQPWQRFDTDTYIRIRQQADMKSIIPGINTILLHQEQLHATESGKEKKDTLIASATPLGSMHFTENFSSAAQSYGGKKIVAIFSILGFLLLLIASINYVNLSTAKASRRSKEVSIKKIVGAGSKSLFAQFMTESLVTAFLALVLTLVMVKLSLPWFNSLTDKTFTLSLFSAALWKVLAGTLLITVLLTGIYPALLLSSFKPLNVLRGTNILTVKNTVLRKTLVTVQFTIAIALSICAIVILKQLHFIQTNNEGYNRKQIFSFSIPGTWSSSMVGNNKTELFRLMKNELVRETAIENITVSNDDIQNIRMSMSGIADWTGKKKDDNPNITLLTTDPDFKKIFKLQLQEGRWFSETNPTDQHNYILSETAAATFGLKKPYLGQYFAILSDTGQVIGIVKDFHFQDFHHAISAAVLLDNPLFKGTFFVEAAANKMDAALAKATTTFKKFFPHTPFEYNFMDASFEKMYRADTKTAALVGAFSAIAIFISCLGLFGLISFVAEQRTKEIGIRKILGATIVNITTLLSKDFMQLVVLSIVIASPVAWWAMNKWLEAFVYRISISWWMFAIAGAAAIIIAMITISIQAIKAATANPVRALRSE